ncbi:MAG: RidA family protein [Bdellovibrionota bacterium]
MKKEAISTTKAPGAIGPYSQAIRVGDLLFTSGQIALDPISGSMAAGDVKTQTRQVLTNLKEVLEAGGSNLAKVIKTTVFVMDLGQFATINAEYESFFKEFAMGSPFPSRSTVQVSALPRGSLVEIEAIAQI